MRTSTSHECIFFHFFPQVCRGKRRSFKKRRKNAIEFAKARLGVRGAERGASGRALASGRASQLHLLGFFHRVFIKNGYKMDGKLSPGDPSPFQPFRKIDLCEQSYSFRALLAPLGSLLAPFGSLLAHFWRLLVHFYCLLVTFFVFSCIFDKNVMRNRIFT